MEDNRETTNRFFVNIHKYIYIYITSILAYFILNALINNQNINIPLMFRNYYIILSIVLFVLLKQVKKFYKQYVSKIVVIFFSLMIFVSAIGFIININEKNFLSQFTIIYITVSNEIILLIETFCSYVLSEYYFKNKELKKASYEILILIIVSLGLIYYYEGIINFIKIIYLFIEVPLFVRIILNMKKSVILKTEEYNILKIYICSTIIILLANIYGFYNHNKEATNIIIEIIHLINFRIIWNFIIIKLIREPYKTLSNSLNEKNQELDKLNHKI